MPAREVSPGVLSNIFWNDGKAYIEAAKILIRESQTDQPTYFLLSHALELILKAHLAAHGVSEQKLKSKPFRHDIGYLFDEAIAKGLRVDGEQTPILVRALSEFHDAFVFRYPVINKDGDLVVVRTVVNASDVLEHVTEISRLVQGHVIRARLGCERRSADPYRGMVHGWESRFATVASVARMSEAISGANLAASQHFASLNAG